MTLPFVSVVIPAYNGERYIIAAVESVLQQTYQHFEMIVVDDGSTDGTAAVLSPYCDRIRYVQQSNQGVASARNRGLQLAQGELIAFLDQDDIWLPDKLLLQVACLEVKSQVGMVHSGWQRVDQDGEKISNIEPWHNAPKLDLHEWLQWMPVLLSAMLFRLDWIERVGGFDSEFKQACDVDLIQRLALATCQTAWVRQVVVLYRQHSCNDSLNTLLQAKESWAVRNKFFARSDIPHHIRKMEDQYRYHTLVWIAWRLHLTKHFKEMKEYLEMSLRYTSHTAMWSLFHWSRVFPELCSENGYEFDSLSFTNSKEWKYLVYQALSNT